MRSLFVIIPSKTASNLKPCLQAIIRQDSSVNSFVIDDGVDWPQLHPLLPKGMLGIKPFCFSRAINQGILAFPEGDICVLNDDAILHTRGGFSLLQKAAEEHPEYGIISATTNNVGNLNQRPKNIGLREEPRMVCFIAVLIPRSTIERVGLLDERFGGPGVYGFEDDDYCYRVRQAGLKIGIHDGVFVDHASLKSTFRGDPRTPAELTGGRSLFVEKWGSHPL